MARRTFDDSKAKRAGVYDDQHGNTQLAIFVHGYRGTHLGTWGKVPKALKAEASKPFSEWDYLFVGFNTDKLESYADIADLLRTEITQAAKGASFSPVKYQKFCLIGHSLGTLGIRQLICDHTKHSGQLPSMIHSVLLFGGPTNGSWLAKVGRVIFDDTISGWLEPGCGQLAMLHRWTGTYHDLHKPWPRVEPVYGTEDMVVGSKYRSLIDWPGDQPESLINAGHASMKEPTDWDVKQVKGFILQALQ